MIEKDYKSIVLDRIHSAIAYTQITLKAIEMIDIIDHLNECIALGHYEKHEVPIIEAYIDFLACEISWEDYRMNKK